MTKILVKLVHMSVRLKYNTMQFHKFEGASKLTQMKPCTRSSLVLTSRKSYNYKMTVIQYSKILSIAVTKIALTRWCSISAVTEAHIQRSTISLFVNSYTTFANTYLRKLTTGLHIMMSRNLSTS